VPAGWFRAIFTLLRAHGVVSVVELNVAFLIEKRKLI
jgi:hypothetical protein